VAFLGYLLRLAQRHEDAAQVVQQDEVMFEMGNGHGGVL